MADPALPTHSSISDNQSSLEKPEQFGSEKPAVGLGENINARLVNPLIGFTDEELLAQGEQFAKQHGLGHLTDAFSKGAVVAKDPMAFESLTILDQHEKETLRMEITHKWKQPRDLYYLVIVCSMAAAVQGVRYILSISLSST